MGRLPGRESHGVGGGKDEVDVEGESYPRSPRFTGEKGVGSEERMRERRWWDVRVEGWVWRPWTHKRESREVK